MQTCTHPNRLTVTTDLEVKLLKLVSEMRYALRLYDSDQTTKEAEIGSIACWSCLQSPFKGRRTSRDVINDIYDIMTKAEKITLLKHLSQEYTLVEAGKNPPLFRV